MEFKWEEFIGVVNGFKDKVEGFEMYFKKGKYKIFVIKPDKRSNGLAIMLFLAYNPKRDFYSRTSAGLFGVNIFRMKTVELKKYYNESVLILPLETIKEIIEAIDQPRDFYVDKSARQKITCLEYYDFTGTKLEATIIIRRPKPDDAILDIIERVQNIGGCYCTLNRNDWKYSGKYVKKQEDK